MSKSGLYRPETIGFGVLGATIGFVACSVFGHETSGHTGIGMATGALLMIGLAHLPLQRVSHALHRARAPGQAAKQAASR